MRVFVVVLFLASALAQVFPDPDWSTEDPLLHGMDPVGLQRAGDLAEELNSDCFVVARHGVIVAEFVYGGSTPETTRIFWSATKSVTSTLVGIAQDRGLLNIDQPASTFIPEWANNTDGRERVTIRNLISNDSGRRWTFISDYITPQLQADQTQYAIDLGQDHLPGVFWEYNNMAIQTLARVIERATGMSVSQFAEQTLFGPLKLSANSTWDTDNSGTELVYSSIHGSCRDLAKFAYLWAQGGRWSNGQQLVSPAFVQAAVGQPSQPLNSAYGFMFWLNRNGHWVGPSAPGRSEGDGKYLGENVPEDFFCAIGLGDQIACYDPSTQLVIARGGSGTDAQGSIISRVYESVRAAVIA